MSSKMENRKQPTALTREDTLRRQEQKILDERFRLVTELKKHNLGYYKKLINLVEFDETKTLPLRSHFTEAVKDLKEQEHLWEHNVDTFEQLREEVGARDTLLKSLVEHNEKSLQYRKENQEDKVSDERKANEGLIEKLKFKNQRVTALELRVDAEAESIKKLEDWFNGKIKRDIENDNIFAQCFKKNEEEETNITGQENDEESPDGVTNEEGHSVKTLEEFDKFWTDHFGCKLQRNKLEELIATRNEADNFEVQKEFKTKENAKEPEDSVDFSFDNDNNFDDDKDEDEPPLGGANVEISPKKEDSIEEITPSIFRHFLRFTYGILPDEACYLIKDQIGLDKVTNRDKFDYSRQVLFLVLWILLLCLLASQLGGSDRYWQNNGVKQILLDTIWDDKRFENINSVGTFYQYMNAVVIPFTYGLWEWNIKSDDGILYMDGGTLLDSSFIQNLSNFNNSYDMNPYVLGLRIRQFRFKPEKCKKFIDEVPMYAGHCVSEQEESDDWEKWRDISPFDNNNTLVDSNLIKVPTDYYDYKQLDEAYKFIGETKTNFKGGGYVVDFLPPNPYDLSSCTDRHGPNEMCTQMGCGEEPYEVCDATYRLAQLQENFFIDGQTRGIFVDINVFNPSSRKHTLARLSFEARYGLIYSVYTVETWNILMYEDGVNVLLLTLFMICAIVFTGLHLTDCVKSMNLLGYPCCCIICPFTDIKQTRRMAKLSTSTRWYVSETGKEVSFMEYTQDKDDETKGTLVIPIENLTSHKVKQLEEHFLRCLRSLLRTYDKNVGVSITKIMQTDYGGCEIKMAVTGGYKVFGSKTDPKKTEIYTKISEDLSEELALISKYDDINILADTDPTTFEWVVGHGAITFYSSFIQCVDSILVFFIWLYFCVHMATYPGIDSEKYIRTSPYVSFRDILSQIIIEMGILFCLTFISSLKLMEWLTSVNHQIRLTFTMLAKVARLFLSFIVFIIYILLCFSMSGWVLFSSDIFEFRNFARTFGNLIPWIVTEMPYEEIVKNNTLGSFYFFIWIILIEFILLNVALAIILTMWDQVNEELVSNSKSKSWFPKINRLLGWDRNDGSLDPKDDWLTEPAEWRRVYPAGCPVRRLKPYLINQLDIEDTDADQLLELVDVDKSGTIVWEELKKLLKDFKPNVENKNFAIRRKHTREVVQYASALDSQVEKFKENYKNKMELMVMNLNELKNKIQELN